MKYTIAIDFDGVIHKSRHGYMDGTIYDDPMPGAKEAIDRFNRVGFQVMCFTARNPDSAQAWLLERMGLSDSDIKVVNTKPPALVYIDDRAVRFENWNQTMRELERLKVFEFIEKGVVAV